MIECAKKCCELNISCPVKDCRQWIDYEDDLNCINVAVDKNGPMKLRQIAERLGITTARAQQIEKAALAKLKKLM
jgi:predicted transcriptional regulator|tara:strand:+ start:2810 stop:3034 length:225 start_codon:yes stop_codon:yes gene_type:complete